MRYNYCGDILYLYDESGIVGAVQTYNTTTETFYFDRNIKGDVIGIYNASGAQIAKYSYDSWGNPKITTLSSNNFSGYNPIRYRGYYFDAESGLYFLNARYYNPQWRRFISPDDTAYLDPDTPNGLNLYAYCNNDPVNFESSSILSNNLIVNSISPKMVYANLIHSTNEVNRPNMFNIELLKSPFRKGLFFGEIGVYLLYSSCNLRVQASVKNGKIVLGTFANLSLLHASGQIGIGDDNLNASVVGVADVGVASLMAGILIDPKNNTYFAGIEAKASLFTARGGLQFEVFETQVEVGYSGYLLSVGLQFGIGISEDELYFKSGIAALVGYDVYVRIKFA